MARSIKTPSNGKTCWGCKYFIKSECYRYPPVACVGGFLRVRVADSDPACGEYAPEVSDVVTK